MNVLLRTAAVLMVCVMFSLCTVTSTFSRYNGSTDINSNRIRAGLFRVCVKDGERWLPITGSGGSVTFTVDLVSTLMEASLAKKENHTGHNSGGNTYGSDGEEVDVYTPEGGVARIAPGTGGEVVIGMKNFSEVGVNVTISVNTAALKIPDGLAIEWNTTNAVTGWQSSFPDLATAPKYLEPLSKVIDTAEEDDSIVEYKVYWRWKYETGTVTSGVAAGDATDTGLGISENDNLMNLILPLSVTATQKD